MNGTTFPWIIGFALLGSVGAIGVAALFLLFPKRVREQLVPFLVSYATGTLLGASLLGLLPEAIKQGGLLPGLGSVLAGLLVFFVLERFLIWRHCHHEGPCEVHGAAGQLILVGDALHNFVDGAVTAPRFYRLLKGWFSTVIEKTRCLSRWSAFLPRPGIILRQASSVLDTTCGVAKTITRPRRNGWRSRRSAVTFLSEPEKVKMSATISLSFRFVP